jgi:pyruvate dehydrogenase E1 component alpha subunit
MTSRTKEQGAAEPAGNNGFTLISNEKLLQLYTTMLKCRMIEERARALFKQGGAAGNGFLSPGQEAAVVAVAIDLLPKDVIAPSHRDFMLHFIEGEPLRTIFGRLLARPDRPVEGIASQLDIATKAAQSNKKKKNGKIAVAFCGDSSASLSSLPSAFDLASAQRLPLLFIFQSNRSVFQNDRSIQPASLARRSQAPDSAALVRVLPWITVDGNDVVAVYRVATEAVTQARKGNGPTLIECRPYSPQSRAGTAPGKSRAPDRVQRSNPHDPILNMENYLTGKGIFSPKIKREAVTAFSSELDAATKSLNY